MKKALIGYTGFIGGNLAKQKEFDYLFNSKNIAEIKGKSFDLVVCAAPSAVKWLANKEPEKDLELVNSLIKHLKNFSTEQFVQISTVDVYKRPINVNEDTKILSEDLDPYGKHRFYLEEFVQRNFINHLIVRLPGLFGEGIKKNLIFDMLNSGSSEWTHKDSRFQFYYLKNLWEDIEAALRHSLRLVNFATEPLSVSEMVKKSFGVDFTNVTENPPVSYDMRTKYAKLWGHDRGYLHNKEEVLSDLKNFVSTYRKKNPTLQQ